jgi:hypothetical protein
MPYFSNMPTLDYPLKINGKTVLINARNILVRAKIIDRIKSTQAAYLNYTIRDGERPETLAARVYGQPDLHWVVLLFNEILDPLFEWPLSSNDLESAVNTKYTGKTLFIDLKRVNFERGGIVSRAKEELWFEVGGTVTQGNAEGKVLAWDPNLYKIVIEQTSGTNFSTTPSVTNPQSEYMDLIHRRSDGVVLYAPIGRVVDDNRYAVHHFEDSETGEVVDHHSILTTANGELVDSSVMEFYAVYSNELIRLPNRDVVAVSNYQHEIASNDSKRNIKMMRPELIDLVIKDMRKIFGG